MSSYYAEESPYLETDKSRGRNIGKKSRSVYHNFIRKVWIPFLKEKHIKSFSALDPPLIIAFQNFLLKKGNKPQTVNKFMGGLNAIFEHLVMHGTITGNVFDKVPMLKVSKKNYVLRGCHELNTLTGAFNKRWKDPVSYLLCLVIYTTGMRNSEIECVKVKDIIKIKDCHFINIEESKTQNGVRMVPLHDFVYKKLMSFITKTGKQPEDRLFVFSAAGTAKHNQSTLYNKANIDLGTILKIHKQDVAGELERQGITFYSGRHYWKTLMNAEELGDVEEYFMGHKVSRDIAKRYNHRDKQGQEKILEKAREVFAILDKRMFK
jgi:integrase